MKLTHKLCGAALLTVLGVGLAAPGATKAAEDNSKAGDADIQFTKPTYGSYDSTGGVIPPDTDKQSTTDTDPTKLVDGEFVVQGMSKLVFNEQAATTGAIKSFAKPTTANDPAAADYVSQRANWVQFKDDRLVDDRTYELTAKLVDTDGKGAFKFDDNGKIRNIAGTTIDYKNTKIVAHEDNVSLLPSTSGLKTSIHLAENVPAKLFTATENNTGKGRGKYAVYFGDTLTNTDTESVELSIPANQADDIRDGNYSAKVLWTLSETPMQ
ncbi:WxL domain-containing protein [Enterococcus sp. AZ126]|uniref:WxL domain-containing protein n=1 Tax=Enterococcus sp. AZ126 TaxID=2774635 RepID=UPI003F1F8FBF